MRMPALVAALLAVSLSTTALSAQSATTSTTKPAAAPAMKHAPAMHEKMDSSAKPTASAKPATARHAAWTKDEVKEAQEGLAKAGLYKGKVSGILNADTRSALRSYQKQNKLPVTGRLSDQVLAKLKSA